MYPAAIEEYVRPATVAEALAALGRYEAGDALFMAGGQSTMQAIKTRLLRPRCIVDLQAVAELRGVSNDGAGVRIGAMTTYVALAEESSLDGAYQALRDAAARIGDRQVRNRGTIGGSLCWNYIAACLPPVALALGMEMALTDGGGERKLAADDFLGGPLETAREDDEILVSLNLPAAPANTGSAYKKWGLVTDALPVIGVAAMIGTDGSGACSSARVAVGGLGDGPRRSAAAESGLKGASAGDFEAIAAALQAASDEIETQSDMWADADYRKQLIRSLGADAVASAFARAAG
ncbi:MAG: FAD binding domain-containing protein [Alphaproteobacteria bacterium]|nr:FAD binding domain-containing protein [Alphaproteobacteria bacterium]